MPTGKTLLGSSAFRLGLAMAALLCVAGAVLGVRYFAQAAPFITTDKGDYFANEVVTITGSGFAPNTFYDVPVIRPDGTIVKGDGTFIPGWDTVHSNAAGAFTYLYRLDGIPGLYEARVYASPWDGIRSTSPIASTTFRDGNVKVFAAPDGVTFTLTATKYSTTDCSGSGSTNTYTHVDSKTFGIGSTESIKLQAASTSDQGGSFINWTSSYPFTNLGGGVICVVGFDGGGGHEYDANYGGTPTPVPPSPTPTNTPVPSSPTPTDTPVPPSPTPTLTPVPPSPTSTDTPVPPSPTSTDTPVPPSPTSTDTPVPPSPTSTNTPVPPSPTSTNTPVPPTATFTPVPPTPIHTPTPHGVGGKVLLPPAAVASQSNGTSGGSGQTVATWAALVVVAGAFATGGLYVRSRRRSR